MRWMDQRHFEWRFRITKRGAMAPAAADRPINRVHPRGVSYRTDRVRSGSRFTTSCRHDQDRHTKQTREYEGKCSQLMIHLPFTSVHQPFYVAASVLCCHQRRPISSGGSPESPCLDRAGRLLYLLAAVGGITEVCSLLPGRSKTKGNMENQREMICLFSRKPGSF